MSNQPTPTIRPAPRFRFPQPQPPPPPQPQPQQPLPQFQPRLPLRPTLPRLPLQQLLRPTAVPPPQPRPQPPAALFQRPAPAPSQPPPQQPRPPVAAPPQPPPQQPQPPLAAPSQPPPQQPQPPVPAPSQPQQQPQQPTVAPLPQPQQVQTAPSSTDVATQVETEAIKVRSPSPTPKAASREPTPPQSPKIIKTAPSPLQSPPAKPSPPLPPPPPPPSLPLPPSQLKPEPEPEFSKTMLVQDVKKMSESVPRAAQVAQKSEFPSGATPRHIVADVEVPIRVITLAGENKGAWMEIGSPSSLLHYKKKLDTMGTGRRLQQQLEGDDAQGNGTEMEKKYGKGANSTKAPPVASPFVNSNVQSVNNSIVLHTTCTVGDPGVCLTFSRKPASAHGYRHKDRPNGHPT